MTNTLTITAAESSHFWGHKSVISFHQSNLRLLSFPSQLSSIFLVRLFLDLHWTRFRASWRWTDHTITPETVQQLIRPLYLSAKLRTRSLSHKLKFFRNEYTTCPRDMAAAEAGKALNPFEMTLSKHLTKFTGWRFPFLKLLERIEAFLQQKAINNSYHTTYSYTIDRHTYPTFYMAAILSPAHIRGRLGMWSTSGIPIEKTVNLKADYLSRL